MLADRGHGESCLILGEMCEKGLGRQRDYQAAFGFYSESFQQGVDRGAYRAGMLMREDALRVTEVRDIALTWLEEAIKALRNGIAMCLALTVAYYLNLDEPYWAMTSAAVVSFPTVGGVISKSLGRVAGSLLGATAALIIAAVPVAMAIVCPPRLILP